MKQINIIGQENEIETAEELESIIEAKNVIYFHTHMIPGSLFHDLTISQELERKNYEI